MELPKVAFPAAKPPATPEPEEHDEGFGLIIRQGLIVILLFFGILGGWAVFGKISGAVVVPGTIIIDTERKTVQHLEGGIIDTIHVREGDRVDEGQSLITLKSVTVNSSVDMANKNLILFLAARNRYEAEKSLFQPIRWDSELLELAQKYNSRDVLESEQKMFEARRASYQSQVELLDSQIAQVSQQILGLREEMNAEKAIIATLAEELKAKRILVEKKYLDTGSPSLYGNCTGRAFPGRQVRKRRSQVRRHWLSPTPPRLFPGHIRAVR